MTAVAGLTVLTGFSGQVSLGHGAFMAIGAYTTALLLLHLNWPFYLVLIISGALSAAVGAVVGAAAARLTGRTWPAPRCCSASRCPRSRTPSTGPSGGTRA